MKRKLVFSLIGILIVFCLAGSLCFAQTPSGSEGNGPQMPPQGGQGMSSSDDQQQQQRQGMGMHMELEAYKMVNMLNLTKEQSIRLLQITNEAEPLRKEMMKSMQNRKNQRQTGNQNSIQDRNRPQSFSEGPENNSFSKSPNQSNNSQTRQQIDSLTTRAYSILNQQQKTTIDSYQPQKKNQMKPGENIAFPRQNTQQYRDQNLSDAKNQPQAPTHGEKRESRGMRNNLTRLIMNPYLPQVLKQKINPMNSSQGGKK